MVIVDAHVHIWESRSGPSHHRADPLTADAIVREMDEAHIDRAINCPPIWDKRANAIAIEASRRYPDRLATTGFVELSPSPSQKTEEAIASWKQQPGMLGLRFVVLATETNAWFRSGQLDWIWAAAEKNQIPVALTAPGNLDIVFQVAKRFPALKLAVDHMGLGPFGTVPAVFDHISDLLALAALPNVSVKATAAPGYASDIYPFQSMHGYLHDIYSAFGPKRMFWGSDITRLNCSWSECASMFTHNLPWLSGEDLEEVMGKAVLRWLQWG